MASGRKREFNERTALHAAMDVFWTKGYMGATLADLTKSMGINKPSMYSAFGNKESLFIKATELYIEHKAKAHFKELYKTNIPFNIRLRNNMQSIVAMQCGSNKPKGCLLVLCQAEIAGGEIPEAAAQLLNQAEVMIKNTFVDLFNTDAEAIAIGLNKNAEHNALCLYTTVKGTASMARLGVPLADLEYVIDSSLRGIGIICSQQYFH